MIFNKNRLDSIELGLKAFCLNWVKYYLNYLEKITHLKVVFYYVFPTTIRVILSNKDIPSSIFNDCKKNMWWLEKYE